jgi:DDE family transposase
MLKKIGVDVIFPIHAARNSDFRHGMRLGKKDHIVEWFKPQKPEWMDQETYDSFPKKFVIREVSITSCRKGYRTQSRIIVTTFLDPKKLSKEDLNSMYSCRWWVELDIRSIKTTLKMDILRGKTPDMVRKEIWTHILGYNLIRKIMAEAAFVHRKNPRELSFKLALHVTKSFLESGILSNCNEAVYSALLKAIVRRKIGNRPGRSEPRVVKRRPKAFPRMQKPRIEYHLKKVA